MIVLLGLAEAAFLAAFGWLDGIALPLPRLLLPAGALLCYGIAGWTTARNRDGGDGTAVVWGVAVLARLSLLPLAPELSDDVYRYLWDGRVLSEGTNPYAHPPSHDALAALRAPWHDRINHPDVPTIYPPLAQLLFALASVAGGTVLAAKSLWLVLDLGCGFLLQRVAVRTGRRPAPVLLWYLWSPLLIVETAWSAHFDAAGLFLLAALLWLAAGRGRRPGPELHLDGSDAPSGAPRAARGPPRAPRARPAALGAVLALATLVKLAPAALLPALLRRRGVWAGIAFAATSVAFYLPFTGAGDALPGPGIARVADGLRTWAERWSANPGAFALVETAVGDPATSRVAVAVVVLGAALYAAWRRFSLERAMLWTVGAGLLFSPTVHPWYVLWILPAAALRGSRPFLLLSGLAFLGYWGLASHRAGDGWPQPTWTLLALWLPVWALLLAEAAKAARRRAAQCQVAQGEEEQEAE